MKRLSILLTLLCMLTANAFSQSKQFLYIEFTPTDAILELNGEIQETEDGIYQELLPFGEYSYKLSREGYSDQSGVININSLNETHYHELKLKRPIGRLSIYCDNMLPEECSKAEVYIGDKLIGSLPVVDYSLASGTYSITIKHPLYITYTETIVIEDETSTEHRATLEEKYIEVILITRKSAAIYADGKFLGKGKWFGRLPLQQPITFESREVGHDVSTVEYILLPENDGETICLPDPTPAYGSVVITSKPSKATIFIDGEFVGQTPKYIYQILSGTHHIVVKNTESIASKLINIKKGEETNVHLILESIPNSHEKEIAIMDYQEEVVEEEVEEEAIPFQMVSEQPTFMGKDAKEFGKWVGSKIQYPEMARENNVQGRVILQFTIEKDGSLTNIKVVRGVDPALDKEALRVVSSSPKWKPGMMRDKAVRVNYTFPVDFRLRN